MFPCNHAVVNTVYEGLLPARGHAVHMIRPMAGVSEPQRVQPSWPGGSLVAIPLESLGSASTNVLSAWRRRRAMRRAVSMLDTMPLDVVIVRNDLRAAAQAMKIARRRNIPFVYQLSSPDAEFRVSHGRKVGGLRGVYEGARGQLDLMLRRRVLRRASAVLAISDAMATYLIGRDGLDPARVFSFPMGANDFAPPSAETIKNLQQTLGLTPGRTIVCSGAMIPHAVRIGCWPCSTRSAERLPDAVLLMLTYQAAGEPRRQAFEAEAVKRGGSVKVVGPLTNREVFAHMQAADVMVAAYPPMLEFDMSSPTKSIEAMSAALPVVGSSEIAEHVSVFGASQGGVAVRWDQTAFADTIVALLTDDGRRKAMGEAGRQWVLTHRTYERLTTYLDRILKAASSRSALQALPHEVERL